MDVRVTGRTARRDQPWVGHGALHQVASGQQGAGMAGLRVTLLTQNRARCGQQGFEI